MIKTSGWKAYVAAKMQQHTRPIRPDVSLQIYVLGSASARLHSTRAKKSRTSWFPPTTRRSNLVKFLSSCYHGHAKRHQSDTTHALAIPPYALRSRGANHGPSAFTECTAETHEHTLRRRTSGRFLSQLSVHLTSTSETMMLIFGGSADSLLRHRPMYLMRASALSPTIPRCCELCSAQRSS